MKAYQIIVEGSWAHFKKPETNNNPLSHDMITKTALFGLMGAVVGIEREDMKHQFPLLSEDILYGVQLLNPVKKISWGFSSTTAINPTKPGSPKYFEFLKNPKFRICIALINRRSEQILNDFIKSVKQEECIYPPVLGWHNCPADLSFESEGEITQHIDAGFSTFGFVDTDLHQLKDIDGMFRIGFDKLPTYQNDEFWNPPQNYRNIVYPDYLHSLNVEGEYFEYVRLDLKQQEIREQWWLI